MCGRFALHTPPDRIARIFGATLDVPADRPPSWNVAPTHDVLGVTADDGGARTVGSFRWGLVSPTATRASSRLVNARAETVATRSTFRDALARRRVVVPADGFYEWRRGSGRGRQPHYFHRPGGTPLALAGLWSPWRTIRTCVVVTTRAGTDMDGIHDRMPVVLGGDDLEAWLDPANDEPRHLQSLLAPAPSGTLVHHPVDPRVGNVRNDDPGLVAEQRHGEQGALELR